MGKISFIYFLLMCFLLLGSKMRSIILYKMKFIWRTNSTSNGLNKYCDVQAS